MRGWMAERDTPIHKFVPASRQLFQLSMSPIELKLKKNVSFI